MIWVQSLISRFEPIEPGEPSCPRRLVPERRRRRPRSPSPNRGPSSRGRTVSSSMSRGWCRVEVALSDTSRFWFLLAVGTRGRGRNVQCRRPCNGARTSLCPAASERRSRVPGTSHHLQCNDIPLAPLLSGTLRPSTPCVIRHCAWHHHVNERAQGSQETSTVRQWREGRRGRRMHASCGSRYPLPLLLGQNATLATLVTACATRVHHGSDQVEWRARTRALHRRPEHWRDRSTRASSQVSSFLDAPHHDARCCEKHGVAGFDFVIHAQG
jgi:hypothetical protein